VRKRNNLGRKNEVRRGKSPARMGRGGRCMIKYKNGALPTKRPRRQSNFGGQGRKHRPLEKGRECRSPKRRRPHRGTTQTIVGQRVKKHTRRIERRVPRSPDYSAKGFCSNASTRSGRSAFKKKGQVRRSSARWPRGSIRGENKNLMSGGIRKKKKKRP